MHGLFLNCGQSLEASSIPLRQQHLIGLEPPAGTGTTAAIAETIPGSRAQADGTGSTSSFRPRFEPGRNAANHPLELQARLSLSVADTTLVLEACRFADLTYTVRFDMNMSQNF
jgi:hypothetical protein